MRAQVQQTTIGRDIEKVEAQWQALVAKNQEIDLACRTIEGELEQVAKAAAMEE